MRRSFKALVQRTAAFTVLGVCWSTFGIMVHTGRWIYAVMALIWAGTMSTVCLYLFDREKK